MNALQILSSVTDASDWVLRSSGRAAIAIVAVLIVRALFRRRLPARWRYALWLVVPVASLLPRLPQTRIGVTQYAGPQVVRYVLALDSTTVPAQVVRTIATPSPVRHQFTWREIGGVVWTGGTLALTAFWIASHLRALRRIRQTACSPDARVVSLIKECSKATGLRRVPIIVASSEIPSPAVTGLVRPSLLLPADLESRFSHDELRLMLLHELAHIRRGDLLTNAAATAMLAFHWFNPLMWIAASCMRTDREAACDATVLGASATDERAAYGETLLKLQAALSTSNGYPAFVGILENTRRIRDRILRIAAFRRGGAAWGFVAAAVAAGLLACLAAEPPAPAGPASTPSRQPAPSLEQRLRRLAAKGQLVEVASIIRQLQASDLERLGGELPRLSGEQRLKTFILAGVRTPQQIAALMEKLPAAPGASAVPASQRLDASAISDALFGANGTDPKPRVTTRSGQRAVIEIIREFRYPTEWKDPDASFPQGPPTPTSIETRNLGITLSFEPTISAVNIPIERTIIDLNVCPQVVFFTGWKSGKTPSGHAIKSPIFSDTPPGTTSVSVFHGDSLVFVGDYDVPDENRWGLKDVSIITDDVPTHRATILWLITLRLVNSKGEPGFSETPLAPELFEPRDWQFTNMPIEQCVAHFTALSRTIDPQRRGLNIVLGKPAKEPRTVTIDLRRTNLVTALELSAKAAGFRAEENGENTVVLTP
jgi:beta-lactamase regulating signal transducer with metallopeptidase domain